MNKFFLPVLLSLSLGVTHSYAQEDPKTIKKEEKKIQRDEQGDLGKKADKKEAKMYKKEDKMDEAADHNKHRKATRQKGKLRKKDEKMTKKETEGK
jgi:hypothetical protein